jgi:hypothetical protein
VKILENAYYCSDRTGRWLGEGRLAGGRRDTKGLEEALWRGHCPDCGNDFIEEHIRPNKIATLNMCGLLYGNSTSIKLLKTAIAT